MRMTRWLVTVVLFACSGAALAAAVWTWVDADGRRHYADEPVEGARRIELPGPPAAPPAGRPSAARNARSPAGSDSASGRGSTLPYRVLRILEPEDGQTLRNIGAVLKVRVEIRPPLQTGHMLAAILDDEPPRPSGRATRFELDEVWRGVHRLQVAVIGPDGQVLERSSPISFVVHQTSLLNPNNPNVSPPPGRR